MHKITVFLPEDQGFSYVREPVSQKQMDVIDEVEQIDARLSEVRQMGKTVGLVPTMGALHEGHQKLVESAKRDNEFVVVSVFVNPLQFNDQKDLDTYPKRLADDIQILKKLEVDALFCPSYDAIYPNEPSLRIDFGKMGKVLEGFFRPNHFEGVGVIVLKLLHIIGPHKVYFGLKDLQQYVLMRRMCVEFNVPVEVVGVPTARDHEGLALSSRNRRLSKHGLTIARNIYKGLRLVKEGLSDNSRSLVTGFAEAQGFLNQVTGLKIEYLELVDATNFDLVSTNTIVNELAICVAGYVENVRLIDNLYLRGDANL